MTDRRELLLIDDNLADVKLALHALGEDGTSSRIVVLRDGQEALDFLFLRGKYAGNTPAPLRIILLDLKLPKVSGFEVLQAIKSEVVTQSIPVVVLSSSNQERDLRESYRLGANSYVQKPVDFEQFKRMISLIKEYWLSVNYPPPLSIGREDEDLGRGAQQ